MKTMELLAAAERGGMSFMDGLEALKIWDGKSFKQQRT